MITQPEHQSICSSLGELCRKAIVEVEECIKVQWEVDAASTHKAKEELKAKCKQEHLAIKQAQKEKMEQAVTISFHAYHIWTDPTFSSQTTDVTMTSL